MFRTPPSPRGVMKEYELNDRNIRALTDAEIKEKIRAVVVRDQRIRKLRDEVFQETYGAETPSMMTRKDIKAQELANQRQDKMMVAIRREVKAELAAESKAQAEQKKAAEAKEQEELEAEE